MEKEEKQYLDGMNKRDFVIAITAVALSIIALFLIFGLQCHKRNHLQLKGEFHEVRGV